MAYRKAPGLLCRQTVVGVLTGADIGQAEQALTVLGRVLRAPGGPSDPVAQMVAGAAAELLASDPATVVAAAHLAAAGLPDPARLTGLVSGFVATADAGMLLGLHERLPRFHLRLAALAVELLTRALAQPTALDAAGGLAALARRATALSDLGVWLSEVGRREQALAAAEEAVRIRRQLAEANPDAYLPDLASALAVHGLLLEEAGDLEQAVTTQTEAAGIFGQLLEVLPDVFAERFMVSARSLARMLRATGRDKEAEQVERALGRDDEA